MNVKRACKYNYGIPSMGTTKINEFLNPTKNSAINLEHFLTFQISIVHCSPRQHLGDFTKENLL